MAITVCGPACTLETKNSGRACGDPQQSYAGAVLETYEVNGYDDSDLIAAVWDGERVTAREYASTRGWTYHNGASVDATPQVQAAALAWYRRRLLPHVFEIEQTRAAAPRVGRHVRSLTRRGKNVGITGEVRWIGPDRYARGCGERVGIAIPGEDTLRFLPAHSVAVLDPEPVDEQALRDYAATARPASWRCALDFA
ncbi:hypothetical protein Psed_6833 (plasmid) [Pseudonocardia dioxanivorans CB1190]|uniref:Uncharacterized protein n=1 Tax=Pseudonocardia dioxanivorans (strain ATCC 55486 / DSM 44775 / JCM 13855 / CB1190) TaxID=675635 RepID=F2L6L0_PSEUX|nr:hypothetical protein [Pseudonocardia dioxanivorans]AEA28904.1 hypothetical protein Psed_6833 [Pseudonocardia dioxanivorans CB1190]